MVRRSVDLCGQKFGRLLVVGRAPKLSASNRGARWVCVCDCGGQTISRSDRLRAGLAKSCGCLSVEVAKATHTTHGHCGERRVSREYQAWVNMRARCSGGQSHCWKNYGGRGINVFPDWELSFDAFFQHVGQSPGRGYELDRIDNNKGYWPGNVRWVTKSENNKNRRSRAEVEAGHVS